MANDFPLLGDPLPQVSVKTTQGAMTLPDDMGRKLVYPLQPSGRFYAGVHHGVCGTAKTHG